MTYYAVAIGKKPGIYNTWDECQEQVNRFPNAKFKKFKNEKDALMFIKKYGDSVANQIEENNKENIKVIESNTSKYFSKLDLEIIENPQSKDILSELNIGYEVPKDHTIAYIDGSYHKDIETYAYGGVLLSNDQQIHFYGIGKDDQYSSMWNVAGELKAAIIAVEIAKRNGFKSIQLCYDYQGIESWATKKWKAKKPATQLYQEYMLKEMSVMDITFKKVKAHTGNIQNEYVDDLARNAVYKIK